MSCRWSRAPSRATRTRQCCSSYFWDTIEACVRRPQVLEALELAGLSAARRHVQTGNLLGVYGAPLNRVTRPLALRARISYDE